MTTREEKELARIAEREKAMGRLAASDVASLLDSDITSTIKMDEIQAMLRIMSVLNVMPTMAEIVQRQLVRHLQNADLTINFKGLEFFQRLTGPEFTNTFARNDNGPGYMTPRDQAEEKLFDYSNTKGRTGKPAVQGVLNRIRTFGSYTSGTNPTFRHESRPKYAALNFSGSTNGPAKLYGKSYMVMKEYIKHNCTFTDKDSFGFINDADAGSKVANFHNLHRLIINMDERKLRALYNAATGNTLPNANVGGMTDYIEAQLHANVMLNRDVAKMCVSRSEAQTEELRKNYEGFTKKLGIQLVYIS